MAEKQKRKDRVISFSSGCLFFVMLIIIHERFFGDFPFLPLKIDIVQSVPKPACHTTSEKAVIFRIEGHLVTHSAW